MAYYAAQHTGTHLGGQQARAYVAQPAFIPCRIKADHSTALRHIAAQHSGPRTSEASRHAYASWKFTGYPSTKSSEVMRCVLLPAAAALACSSATSPTWRNSLAGLPRYVASHSAAAGPSSRAKPDQCHTLVGLRADVRGAGWVVAGCGEVGWADGTAVCVQHGVRVQRSAWAMRI